MKSKREEEEEDIRRGGRGIGGWRRAGGGSCSPFPLPPAPAALRRRPWPPPPPPPPNHQNHDGDVGRHRCMDGWMDGVVLWIYFGCDNCAYSLLPRQVPKSDAVVFILNKNKKEKREKKNYNAVHFFYFFLLFFEFQQFINFRWNKSYFLLLKWLELFHRPNIHFILFKLPPIKGEKKNLRCCFIFFTS